MKRKDFIKKLGITSLSAPLLMECVKAEAASDGSSNVNGSNNGSSAANCTTTPSETKGPFPTKEPSKWAIKDIRQDRKGIQMTASIIIKDKSKSCIAYKDALVDIWHCDADGTYSEYGGSGMQSVNQTDKHFLRGRQTTNDLGEVSFVTIFPGWYPGRAPHIHVEVFSPTGKSLLVTQMAFPKSACDTVYNTATTFYSKGLQSTSNEIDNIFNDGFATELASIEGNINDGYKLTHTIVV